MSDLIDDKVQQDYSRARWGAFFNSIRGTLRGQPAALLPFEEVRSRVHIRGQSDLGIQTVPLARIIGSEGRYRDFDRSFLPLSEKTGTRWKRIGRARYEDYPLPPVELFKLGTVYFVRDGNHRISVARQHGQIDIDAHVVELKTDVELSADMRQQDLLLKEEQSDFYLWTDLKQLRPGAAIEVSEPGGYLDLLRHINGHRYFLGFERGAEVPLPDAVTHWYDVVYLELVDAIRRGNVLGDFPGRTEADLYLWIMDHRHYLTEQAGYDPGPDEAVSQYVAQFGSLRARRKAKHTATMPGERAFLQWSGLATSRPGCAIGLSDSTGYERLQRHIADHQYYLGQEAGHAIAMADAAASWYDRVYLSVVDALERQQATQLFPGQTLADLYLLVMEHLSSLRDQGVAIDVPGAAVDYAERFGKSRLPILLGVLHSARRMIARALVPAAAGEPRA
jgi:hypothetical protein